MLDIRLLRENPETARKSLMKRGDKEKIKWISELLEHDRKWRDGLQKIESLRHERNVITDSIAKLKKEKKPVKSDIEKVKGIPEKIRELEEKNQEHKEKMDWFLMRIPNILHESVPAGKDDSDNKVVKKWGKAPKFGFEPKNHLDIALDLGLIDPERAGKVSGAGFFYLKNELALLDFAIQMFALDFLMKRGFAVVEPPAMITRKAYEGMIDPTDFEMVTYKTDEDLYLIATAEHPIGAMYMGEVLDKDSLPLKIAGVSPCFRKEIGAHGK